MSKFICGKCTEGYHRHDESGCSETWLDSVCDCRSIKGYIKPPSIDAKHLARQRAWSEKTFGPGKRTEGIVNHIKFELDEILADPLDIMEWVDVIILALDGAWRAGWEPQEIITAIKQKQLINEQRDWPDWSQFTEGEAIEHERV